jgi:pyridinium-3,5-biscarboxylic acid mononucleotide sulfurtransferase
LIVPLCLKKRLLEIERCGILFSGGFDSEVLLRAAVSVLGASEVIALTADSILLADFYREHIRRVTSELNVKALFIPLNPLSIEGFSLNTKRRCYICKKELYSVLKAQSSVLGYDNVIDGTISDDLTETRPGLVAASEEGIIHPFAEASMGRKEVAELGSCMGIREYPSDSCLATRIPCGDTITADLLSLVERIEAPLRPSARGRIRVTVSEGRLCLHYSGVDQGLVESCLDELRRTALESGRDMIMNQLDC